MYLSVVTRTVNLQDDTKKCPVRPMYGNDKNCQEAHSVWMWLKKPISNMWSVTKSSIPLRKQSNQKKCELAKCLCDDKCYIKFFWYRLNDNWY